MVSAAADAAEPAILPISPFGPNHSISSIVRHLG